MECSNTVTPHVIALRLNGYIFYFRGNITSSLLDLHHLNELDLSGIDFGGIRIPKFIASIKSLQHLHLSYSNFSGDISFMFENLTNLITLDLSNNHLTASTFNWLLNTSSTLVTLDLSNNQFHGPIPDAFGRLSFLQSLHLSGNMFEGVIPKSFGNLTHLQDLSLSNNHLGVPLDEILGNLSASTQMKSLLLSTTNLTGPVSTTHLSQFSQLEKLDLSYNSLQGKIFEAHFVKLIKLKELDLSSNSLIVDLSPDWVPPFHIEVMHLSRCKIGPSFPPWLHTQKSLAGLDLSNNGISGEVPKWFWNLSTHMMDLNLSHNHMNGIIPDLSSLPLQVFDVCFNHFSGPLPLLKSSVVLMNQNNFSESNISSFICPFSYNYFTVLDLSNNKLAREFPDCWENLPFLEIINLNNNNLSGEIPHGLGSLSFLTTLHLRDNNLSGELPSSLKNCHDMMLLDIGGNSFTGRIPLWLDGKNFNGMTYLSLRHNRFYGGIPQELCQLNRLQMLDLSGNNISGNIPQCFNNFTSLVDKNTTTASSSFVPFSNGSYIDIEHALVQWKGRELEYSKTLGMLKLIDLSSNRLVGNIPKALSSLNVNNN